MAAFGGGGGHQARQPVLDLVGPEAADHRQSPRFVLRIERVDQAEQVVGLQGRAALHANGVLDPLGELHVRAVQAARTLADPQHVGGSVEPFAALAVDPGHGFLEAQQQGLVAGEHLHPLQVGVGLGRDADGGHEG